MIQLNFYGMLMDVVGKNKIQLNGEYTLKQLKSELISQYPQLKNYKYKMAINNTFIVEEDEILKNGDEVSFLPPFSGG